MVVTDASGDRIANAGVSTASSSCANQTAQVLPGVESNITGEDLFSATTDSTGTATAAVLACPALDMVLFVQPPDGSSLTPASVDGPSAITSPTTVPDVLAPAVAVEGNELSGVLVDNNGVAQAGATITLTDSNNQSDVFSTSTASDGSLHDRRPLVDVLAIGLAGIWRPPVRLNRQRSSFIGEPGRPDANGAGGPVDNVGDRPTG